MKKLLAPKLPLSFSKKTIVILLALTGLTLLGSGQMFNKKSNKFAALKAALIATSKAGGQSAESQALLDGCDDKYFPIKGGAASAFGDIFILVNPSVNEYLVNSAYPPISLGAYATNETVFFDLQSTAFDPLTDTSKQILGALVYRGDRIYVVNFVENECGYYDRGAYVRR